MATVKPITARRKIELSQLSSSAVQQETMQNDLDFDKFVTYVSSQVRTNLAGRITAASIDRTIEGASTLTVDVHDYDRTLLRSGLLSNKLDVQIDGLWFRLVTVDKSGDTLTLTFEDREVAILRTYTKWRIAQRGHMTRAEFIYSLIKEVKEFNIPTVIPELHKVQPIEKFNGDIVGIDSILNKTAGINTNYNANPPQDAHRHGEPVQKVYLTVKGQVANPTQIQMANIILATGDNMGVNRELKACAIMTAITESSLINNPGGDGDSAGLFQQRPGWGTYLERTDPETSAKLFYEAAAKTLAAEPDVPYWVICADTQKPKAEYRTRYAEYRTEAERFLNAYGDVSTTVPEANLMLTQNTADTSFFFYRGKIIDKSGLKVRKPENTWKCAQRLADEVDWRAFFVSGTFYFINEIDLFKQQPFAIIHEFDEGISSVDFNYDHNKLSATITLTARIGRWLAPPGSVVVLQDMGPANGRWLVNEFSRNLIGSNRDATITLKKPRPQLPEPLTGNLTSINPTWATAPTDASVAGIGATSDHIDQVLKNSMITFTNSLETSDITFGKIDDRVLVFMLWLTKQGYPIHVSALKSDHSENTAGGNLSAHAYGRAVDIDTYDLGNPQTQTVMQLIGLYQGQLGFNQLIGPIPSRCIPLGYYDATTLAQHKSHIHVGWPI